MKSAEVEKSELGMLERFLLWFLVPTVFSLILIYVLLKIFGYDVEQNVLKLANSIPVIGEFVPDPAIPVKKPETTAEASERELAALNAQNVEKDKKLAGTETTLKQKEQTITELEAKVKSMEEQLKSKTLTDDEYRAQIQQTSTVYANMNPSKSAPILENLTLAERVLLMALMKPADQTKIFEKMDPKIAADTSIMLKDQVTAKDRQIAALQDRIKQLISSTPSGTPNLTASDLGQTFGSMTPKNAATLLVEMETISPKRVTEILNATDTQARAQIMSSLVDVNKKVAADISSRLIP